jgi:hypothetical protein
MRNGMENAAAQATLPVRRRMKQCAVARDHPEPAA